MQPTATTAWVLPCPLRSLASRRASTESFLAASTKPQVLTTATSASAASFTRSQPSASKRPASSSESTSLRAQPRVTSATVRRSGMGSRLLCLTDGPRRRGWPILANPVTSALPRDRSSGLGVALGVGETLHGARPEVVLDLLAVDVELDRARVTEDQVDLGAVLEGLGLALLQQPVEEHPAVVVLGRDPAAPVRRADLDGDLVLGRGGDGAVGGLAGRRGGLLLLGPGRGGLADGGRGTVGELRLGVIAAAAAL